MKDRENNQVNQRVNEYSRRYSSSKATPNWTAERIKYELELRGHTLASLSRDNGLHDSACRIALRKKWYRCERIISDALGLKSPAELFPERYDENGIPIKFSNGLGNQNAKRKPPHDR